MITDEELKELGYEKALRKVFEVRLERKKDYGDSWQKMDDLDFYCMLKMKLIRLENIVKNPNKERSEKKIDIPIDMVNFCLFMIENILKEEENGRR